MNAHVSAKDVQPRRWQAHVPYDVSIEPPPPFWVRALRYPLAVKCLVAYLIAGCSLELYNAKYRPLRLGDWSRDPSATLELAIISGTIMFCWLILQWAHNKVTLHVH